MSEYDPHAIAFGACLNCRLPFGFNPNKVPSIRVNAKGEPDPNGEREPICANCIARANALRAEQGLPPHFIHPEAYSPIPEGEL